MCNYVTYIRGSITSQGPNIIYYSGTGLQSPPTTESPSAHLYIDGAEDNQRCAITSHIFAEVLRLKAQAYWFQNGNPNKCKLKIKNNKKYNKIIQ